MMRVLIDADFGKDSSEHSLSTTKLPLKDQIMRTVLIRIT
jgi:hypothetical protein